MPELIIPAAHLTHLSPRISAPATLIPGNMGEPFPFPLEDIDGMSDQESWGAAVSNFLTPCRPKKLGLHTTKRGYLGVVNHMLAISPPLLCPFLTWSP